MFDFEQFVIVQYGEYLNHTTGFKLGKAQNMSITTLGLSHWLPETAGDALRDVTLGALLAERAQTLAEMPALIFDAQEHEQVNWTYGTLNAKVDELAMALIAVGIGLGDRVAVMAPNCSEWVLLEYALARVGAILVTVNPALREREIDYLLSQGQIAALFASGTYRGFDLGGLLSRMLPTLVMGKPSAQSGFLNLKLVVQIGNSPISGAMGFDALLARSEDVTQDDLTRRSSSVRSMDVAQIQYTSGTTGRPKGAMLTHRGTINNALLAASRAGYTQNDVLVSAMPLFHTAGCVCNVMGMLAVGGCFVCLTDFKADQMLDLIEKHSGTITNAVPTMYVRMLQDEDLLAGTRDLSSWRMAYTGGTSIPPSMMLELHKRIGCEPVIIMGMTECSPVITQTLPLEPLGAKVKTAGVPLPHVEVRIVDPETGAIKALGAEGELLIRGFLVTTGYFDMPDQTAEAIDAEGWLKSGDLATMDAEGHLRIIGRIKDMLIRGGENIYPVEIEELLLEHPNISEAQVVGVPDPEFGEEIFAFVVPQGDAVIEIEALRGWCKDCMARHKVPRHFAVIAEMPKTANGKIRKIELRELAETIRTKESPQ